jgi:hypothetical protein
MTLQDSLTYHRKAFEALKANRFGTWLGFASWYKRWRMGVSTRHERDAQTGGGRHGNPSYISATLPACSP